MSAVSVVQALFSVVFSTQYIQTNNLQQETSFWNKTLINEIRLQKIIRTSIHRVYSSLSTHTPQSITKFTLWRLRVHDAVTNFRVSFPPVCGQRPSAALSGTKPLPPPPSPSPQGRGKGPFHRGAGLAPAAAVLFFSCSLLLSSSSSALKCASLSLS